MRMPTQKRKPRRSQVASFAAPTGGKVSNRNLAIARDPSLPPGAAVLDDFFPTATGVILRRGMVRRASIVANDPVKSIFTYVSGGSQKMFAAVSTGIREITSVATPDVFSGPDVLTGKTSGNWNVVQFATAGGEFLIGVNGSDAAFLYNGTTFTATTITTPFGSGLTTANLSYVWVYKQRIYFLQKDSMNVWYLPVDSVGGALTLLPLGGVFVRGGVLTWGQAWSLDSGGSGGLSEQCVFVTTEGEVAAYQGLFPGDANWTKVSSYRIGRPMGDKAFMRAGGDIVIATTVGFVSLAAASRMDYAALGQNAVSYPIEDDWAEAVQSRGQIDWRVEVWPDQQMALISPPPIVGAVPVLFVVNVNTGKWCIFNNWDARSLGLFQGSMFFGSANGAVRQAMVGGTDEGLPYTGKILPLFDDLGQPGSIKIAKMARAIIRSTFATNPRLSGQSDYNVNLPPTPSLGMPPVGSEWGVGSWGVALWGQDRNSIVTADWVPVGAYGHDISIGVQVTSGAVTPVDVELVRIDLMFDVGEQGT
ncbi:MAG: hypothetical protein ACRCXM_09035 [Beijerinckiaceae bacterium]